MDYLKRMNQAIDYIESNLDDEIDIKTAANIACCSVFYFQRMFSFITDITLSEYIRRRRMTLAAFELKNSSTKVIDVALKYGYQSPDSFSRAFKSLHGVLPSEVSNVNKALKAYPPISFQISIKGDVEMNYRIEAKEAFRVVGIKRNYQGPEDNESVVPKFWNELYGNGIIEQISKLSTGNTKGVHGFIQVLGEEKVDYTIGSISNNEPPVVMISQVIPKLTWAIFEFTGAVNDTMADAWKRIFTEWLPTSNYRHVESVEIECFPYKGDKRDPNYKFEIWIPVEKVSAN